MSSAVISLQYQAESVAAQCGLANGLHRQPIETWLAVLSVSYRLMQ